MIQKLILDMKDQKMKIKVTKIVEFDLDSERKRIKKNFSDNPDLQKKLLDLVDAFENLDFKKFAVIYDHLGYNEKWRYPNAECVNYRLADFVWENYENMKNLERW
jgi:adenine-specific DNA methylase